MDHRILLAFFIFTSCQVAGQSTTYRLKGQRVTWNTTITEQPDDILWKHNGNKVVEFDGQEQQEFGQHQNRIILDWLSADLDIIDLRYEDSGVYDLEVYKENKGTIKFQYKLEVIDRVDKVTISCQMDDGSDSKKSGTLVCSAEPSQAEYLTEYEWSSHGTVQPGKNLTISLGENDDEVYSCSVSNPLSKATATFNAKDCYSNESVSLIATLVPIFIIIPLVLVSVLVLFCKRKRKACFAESDDSEKPPVRREDTENLLHRAPTFASPQPLVQADQQQIETPEPVDVKKKVEEFERNNKGQRPEKLKNRRVSESDEKRHETGPLLDKAGSPQPPVPADQQQDETPARVSVKKKVEEFECNNKGQRPDRSIREKDKDKRETVLPPSPIQRSESPSLQEQNNVARSDKGDADADEAEESAEGKEEAPAGVESSAASEQPELEKESDEDKEPVSPPANGSPPVAKPRKLLTQNSTNALQEDTAEDREEEANLTNVEPVRDDSIEAEPSSTIPEQKDLETSLHEQDKDKDKMDKSASAGENESDSEGDAELSDKEPNLYLADSEQPQIPSPAKPDDSTVQKSADTANAEPDQEEKGKTRPESGESEEETESPKLEKSGQ